LDHVDPAGQFSSELRRLSLPLQHGAILVVEDEDFVREVTCEVLQSEGYQVVRASSAAEAVWEFERLGGGVSLLLTDVVLPGRNGGELAGELRNRHPALGTIYISGYPENELQKFGITEHAEFYLAKPFSMKSLVATVRRALGEFESGAAKYALGNE